MHCLCVCQTFIRYPIPQLGQNDSALNLPVIKKMHYRVNWDLSGRFYHYMGMYAPPIGNGAPQQWLNRWNPFNSRGGRLTYVMLIAIYGMALLEGLFPMTQFQ